MGWDGLFTLLLSQLVILASGGASLLLAIAYVGRLAQRTGALERAEHPVLVLGVVLDRGLPRRDFEARLDRARRLAPTGPILVLGGQTGSGPSEAAAGRAWLIERGVEARAVLVEDGSRNTLENLRAARALLAGRQSGRCVIVTSRYHLARAHTLARGLQLPHELCAAEPRLRLDPSLLGRVLLEALYLNWYYTGLAWATATGSAGMLRRIR